MDDHDITYIGRTNHRNTDVRFGVRRRDRRSHFYVCGKTGTGKSHLLRVMIEQDIRRGDGCALFDPHGDLLTEVIAVIPKEREQDLILLDVPNEQNRWSFNPFALANVAARPLAAAGIVEVFKKLWPDEWGPRLEHLLRNVVFTLLETPNATLADIPALLTDKDYRSGVVGALENATVKEFWKNEYDRYSPPFRAVVTAPLQNKVGALLTDPVVRRILCGTAPRLNLRQIIDSGRIGEGPSNLLGALLVSHLALAGIARSDQSELERRDFFVFLDEFQNFTTLSLATMLSELRKYRLALTLSHQHLSQLESEVRDAVFGNTGSIMCFRVGAADATYLAREFSPVFSAQDLTSLPRYHVYLRLLVEGEPTRPFSATTLPDCHNAFG
jgi:hypothetical protein